MKTSKNNTSEINLSNCWTDISHCMVCWPENGLDEEAGKIVIQRLQDKFPDVLITVILLPMMTQTLADVDAKVFQVKTDHFNFIGLPKGQLKRELADLKADLAIDLSDESDPLSMYCCSNCGAKTRIGFAQPDNGFYNLQIAPKPQKQGLERYKVLAEYIG